MTSVCPFVRLSVTLCIVAFRVGVGLQGLKLYNRVASRQLPIYFFRYFCCRMHPLAKHYRIQSIVSFVVMKHYLQ